MKSPDAVFRELGQLYDFYREIAKLRSVDEEKPGTAPACDPQPARRLHPPEISSPPSTSHADPQK